MFFEIILPILLVKKKDVKYIKWKGQVRSLEIICII